MDTYNADIKPCQGDEGTQVLIQRADLKVILSVYRDACEAGAKVQFGRPAEMCREQADWSVRQLEILANA